MKAAWFLRGPAETFFVSAGYFIDKTFFLTYDDRIKMSKGRENIMLNKRDQLRKDILTKRDQLSEQERSRASYKICQSLTQLPQFQSADAIAFYKAMRSEVDLVEAMEKAWEEGKTVALPRVMSMDGSMDFYQVDCDTHLTQGSCGAYEPPALPEKKVEIDQLQLVIVPGAVFDRQGYRLGYGGGFYDHLFAMCSPQIYRVGIAFDEQIVSTIYPELHDQPVHLTITPKEMIEGVTYE
jgi:5-formyltetrahydrofolate cyclo-ligase